MFLMFCLWDDKTETHVTNVHIPQPDYNIYANYGAYKVMFYILLLCLLGVIVYYYFEKNKIRKMILSQFSSSNSFEYVQVNLDSKLTKIECQFKALQLINCFFSIETGNNDDFLLKISKFTKLVSQNIKGLFVKTQITDQDTAVKFAEKINNLIDEAPNEYQAQSMLMFLDLYLLSIKTIDNQIDKTMIHIINSISDSEVLKIMINTIQTNINIIREKQNPIEQIKCRKIQQFLHKQTEKLNQIIYVNFKGQNTFLNSINMSMASINIPEIKDILLESNDAVSLMVDTINNEQTWKEWGIDWINWGKDGVTTLLKKLWIFKKQQQLDKQIQISTSPEIVAKYSEVLHINFNQLRSINSDLNSTIKKSLDYLQVQHNNSLSTIVQSYQRDDLLQTSVDYIENLDNKYQEISAMEEKNLNQIKINFSEYLINIDNTFINVITKIESILQNYEIILEKLKSLDPTRQKVQYENYIEYLYKSNNQINKINEIIEKQINNYNSLSKNIETIQQYRESLLKQKQLYCKSYDEICQQTQHIINITKIKELEFDIDNNQQGYEYPSLMINQENFVKQNQEKISQEMEYTGDMNDEQQQQQLQMRQIQQEEETVQKKLSEFKNEQKKNHFQYESLLKNIISVEQTISQKLTQLPLINRFYNKSNIKIVVTQNQNFKDQEIISLKEQLIKDLDLVSDYRKVSIGLMLNTFNMLVYNLRESIDIKKKISSNIFNYIYVANNIMLEVTQFQQNKINILNTICNINISEQNNNNGANTLIINNNKEDRELYIENNIIKLLYLNYFILEQYASTEVQRTQQTYYVDTILLKKEQHFKQSLTDQYNYINLVKVILKSTEDLNLLIQTLAAHNNKGINEHILLIMEQNNQIKRSIS